MKRKFNLTERKETEMATEINSTTASGMRLAIVLAGNRNAGKSALLNRLTGQEVSIVSERAGTTTDAVAKAFELPQAGAVCFYDTAGLDDDEGKLGGQRVCATQKVLRRADVVLLVIGRGGVTPEDMRLIAKLERRHAQFIPVFNFCDEYEPDEYNRGLLKTYGGVEVSAKTGAGIDLLRQKLEEKLKLFINDKPLIADLIRPGETVVLVAPVDSEAPKGRLITPQVQVLREALDANAVAVVTRDADMQKTLGKLAAKPALVITDSQAVKQVAATLPDDVPLTTFSILFARHKGDFKLQLDGANAIDQLRDGDKILIAEGCSHHISCDDIGRVKIPNILLNHTGKKLEFVWTSGYDFPQELSGYALVLLCGGCMLNRGEIRQRIEMCREAGVAVTNYGMVIAKGVGVLSRLKGLKGKIL